MPGDRPESGYHRAGFVKRDSRKGSDHPMRCFHPLAIVAGNRRPFEMSASRFHLCQSITSGKQRFRDGEAESLCGLEIDDELELRRQLN
jgi:hypothetical protein